ncbi:small arf-related GTPase ARFRP1 [Pelagophyceae sp. CCMP2097]|nr:small arf-related GTPase ARFRP1 [Pelagophyceae sp. CCMP2097]|mmetsp:Transcript_12492/g.41681  ORF Transcript_12492/g.41681 Transcript_12492/m.41681 type:complete len:195 (+) Transcript_12492:106-690(+)
MALSLIEAFKESCFKRPEVNLLCLGLDGAGKTAALERTKQSFPGGGTTAVPFDKIAPTLGLNIAKLDILGCRAMVWDLGGDAKMRDIWERYYAEAHGVVFVIDAADPARFQEAKEAFSSACAHAELLDVPILIFANKCDLEFVVKPSAVEELLSLGSRAQPLHLQCASALNNEGIEDGINWLVGQAKQRLASPK